MAATQDRQDFMVSSWGDVYFHTPCICALVSANSGAPAISLPYEYYIGNVAMVQNANGAASVQIGEFSFTAVAFDKDRARVSTALNLRDGEKVVVGTASLRSRALVVVLTMKLLK